MRHAAQTDFDRNGNGLFNFFGRTSREKGDDLNLRVGDIGKRFYWERSERRDAGSDKQRHKQNQKEGLIQSKGNKTFNHGALLLLELFIEHQDSASNDMVIGRKTLFNDGVLLDLLAGLHCLAPEMSFGLLNQNERIRTLRHYGAGRYGQDVSFRRTSD